MSILICKPLLKSLGQPQIIVDLAIPYLDIVAFSLIPLLMFQSLKQYSDGLSMTSYSMYATIFANLINILVNYVLIFGKFGFPQLGIIGAAIGTLTSRIMMFMVLYILLKKNRIIKDISRQFFLINKKIFIKIISLGFPTSLQMLFEVGVFTSAIWLSGLLGEVTQSANQIVLNISSFTFMVASGLGLSASIRAGNQKGFNDYPELKRISLSILFLGLIFALIFGFKISEFSDSEIIQSLTTALLFGDILLMLLLSIVLLLQFLFLLPPTLLLLLLLLRLLPLLPPLLPLLLLLTNYYLLATADCLLPTAYYLLPTSTSY